MRKFENFGNALRNIRKSRGYTQAALAHEIGVHGQFISNCERSVCLLPKPAMKKLVKKLGLSVDDRLYIIGAICEDRLAQEQEAWRGIL